MNETKDPTDLNYCRYCGEKMFISKLDIDISPTWTTGKGINGITKYEVEITRQYQCPKRLHHLSMLIQEKLFIKELFDIHGWVMGLINNIDITDRKNWEDE